MNLKDYNGRNVGLLSGLIEKRGKVYFVMDQVQVHMFLLAQVATCCLANSMKSQDTLQV